MKTIALLCLLLSLYVFTSAQKETTNTFSYTDKSGNKVSVNLSILPAFIDTVFLRDNVSFGHDSSSIPDSAFTILEINRAKSLRKGAFAFFVPIKPGLQKYILFMSVHVEPLSKSPVRLDGEMIYYVICDYVMIIKRKLNGSYRLKRLTFTGMEV